MLGAVFESTNFHWPGKPLRASQPTGSISGVTGDALIRMDLPLRGLNDAPMRWSQKFAAMAKEVGLARSRLDSCVCFSRDTDGRLSGLLVVHVGDALAGGSGANCGRAVKSLRTELPFWKWRIGECDFRGASL